MVLLLFFSVDQSVWRCLANLLRVAMLPAQGLMLGAEKRPGRGQTGSVYACGFASYFGCLKLLQVGFIVVSGSTWVVWYRLLFFWQPQVI